MNFGIIGNGSWGTALAKILTDNGQTIYWWHRNNASIDHLLARGHNPNYLSSVHFDTNKLQLSSELSFVFENADCIIIAVPSAYVHDVLSQLNPDFFSNKKIVSAVKGILPVNNLLLNDYLLQHYKLPLQNYFAVLGPCHAEEVAAEKLSYLTFSGVDDGATHAIASHFKTDYLNTIINSDIYGVQFAAILKNIYALGAGMAHGLDYGDNFLSVLIANSADEMAGFLRKSGIQNIEVGTLDHTHHTTGQQHRTNYAASVYLGDLLVTCYSLHSRNRTFGNMIGKGYSVKAAQMEMNMVAEGYNASKCIHLINQNIKADMPIAGAIYKILWEGLSAKAGLEKVEQILI